MGGISINLPGVLRDCFTSVAPNASEPATCKVKLHLDSNVVQDFALLFVIVVVCDKAIVKQLLNFCKFGCLV